MEQNLFSTESGTFKGNTLAVGNHNMYYEVDQNSNEIERTFIVSHGAGTSGRYMNMVATTLLNFMRNSRVVILDLPFHGKSTTAMEVTGLTLNDHAKYVKDTIKSFKVLGVAEGTIHWLGWGVGGSLGLLLAQDNLVDELTLVNASPYWETLTHLIASPSFSKVSACKDLFKTLLFKDINDTDPTFRRELEHAFKDITADAKVIHSMMKAVTPEVFDIRNSLPDIKQKTLVFGGTEDSIAEVAVQHLMASTLPNVTLQLANTGHFTVLEYDTVRHLVSAVCETFK